MVFAVLCLVALSIVAWSRTDFSPPQAPLPISNKQLRNDFHTPLNVRLEPTVQEIAPAKFTSEGPKDTKRTIPSRVTVDPSQPQPAKQSLSLSAPVKQLTKTVTDILTPQKVTSDDKVPLLIDDIKDVTCTSDLVLNVCLH